MIGWQVGPFKLREDARKVRREWNRLIAIGVANGCCRACAANGQSTPPFATSCSSSTTTPTLTHYDATSSSASSSSSSSTQPTSGTSDQGKDVVTTADRSSDGSNASAEAVEAVPAWVPCPMAGHRGDAVCEFHAVLVFLEDIQPRWMDLGLSVKPAFSFPGRGIVVNELGMARSRLGLWQALKDAAAAKAVAGAAAGAGGVDRVSDDQSRPIRGSGTPAKTPRFKLGRLGLGAEPAMQPLDEHDGDDDHHGGDSDRSVPVAPLLFGGGSPALGKVVAPGGVELSGGGGGEDGASTPVIEDFELQPRVLSFA